jgi:hypothetical protein
MSAFGGLILTNKGRALQAKVQAGAALHFNRIGIGDGNLASQSISDLNALIAEKKSLAITKLKTQSGGKAIVGGVLSNQGVAVGFYFREIGVFAQDPNDGEILYCYANSGAGAEYIPATGGPDIVEKNIDIITLTANAANVTADVASGIYALATDVGEMSTVPTTSKIVSGAITELFQSVSDGKTLVAAAITGKGVPTAAADPFATMASNIGSIVLGSGNALPGDVRAGKTFSNDSGTGKVGTVPVQVTGPVTAVTADIILPAGIYDAPITVKGDPDKVTANIKAGANIDGVAGKAQVVDTTTALGASAAQLVNGREAFVNGAKVTGNNANLVDTTTAAGATAAQILAGREGFENGIKRIGTIVDRGAAIFTPSGVVQNIPNGLYTGGTIGASPPNLLDWAAYTPVYDFEGADIAAPASAWTTALSISGKGFFRWCRMDTNDSTTPNPDIRLTIDGVPYSFATSTLGSSDQGNEVSHDILFNTSLKIEGYNRNTVARVIRCQYLYYTQTSTPNPSNNTLLSQSQRKMAYLSGNSTTAVDVLNIVGSGYLLGIRFLGYYGSMGAWIAGTLVVDGVTKMNGKQIVQTTTEGGKKSEYRGAIRFNSSLNVKVSTGTTGSNYVCEVWYTLA